MLDIDCSSIVVAVADEVAVMDYIAVAELLVDVVVGRARRFAVRASSPTTAAGTVGGIHEKWQ